MPIPLLAVLLIGAAVKTGGNILSNHETRKSNRKQAEHQKAVNEANRITTLGNMENELRGGMGSDYMQAGDIDRAMVGQSRANMQNTYLGQLQAESQYTSLLASNERALGELTANQGASGAKMDVNLQSVIERELTEQAAGQRNQIDKGLNLSTYQNKLATDEMGEQSNRLRNKYEEGSAVMSIYNFRRERVNADTKLQNSYLDDVIKDNTYNESWFLADLFGAGAAGMDAWAMSY